MAALENPPLVETLCEFQLDEERLRFAFEPAITSEDDCWFHFGAASESTLGFRI